MDGDFLKLKSEEKVLSFERFIVISINNAEAQRNILQGNINRNSKATDLQSSWHFTRKWHPQVEPLLGSYTNRSHNFEWLRLSLVILYIRFLFTNVFHIKKLKNVKRVCPKRTKKDKKNENKVQKNENIWTPKGKKRPWKWASENATTIYFMHNNDCVQLVIHATIHDSQNCLILASHSFNFI